MYLLLFQPRQILSLISLSLMNQHMNSYTIYVYKSKMTFHNIFFFQFQQMWLCPKQVIPVVPSLPVQQFEVLSSPVWRWSCSPGREHTVHSPGTQTAAPEDYIRYIGHVFVSFELISFSLSGPGGQHTKG